MSVLLGAGYLGLVALIGRFPQQRSGLLIALHLGILLLYLGSAVLPILLLALLVFYGTRWLSDSPRLLSALQLGVIVAWVWIAYRLVIYQGIGGVLQAVGGPVLPTLAPVVYSWGLSSLMLQLLHYLQIARQTPGERPPLSDYLAWLFFLPALGAGLLVDFYAFQTQMSSPPVSGSVPNPGWRLAGAAVKGLAVWALSPWLSVPWEQWWSLGLFDQMLTAALSGGVLYLSLSGAADFALVAGHWLGLRLPENFVYPFAQGHMLGFWLHWHITLRQRLMALVYLPMARLPRWRWLAFGLMMGVWGLWYGPSWHCGVGGLCMGVALAYAYRQPPAVEQPLFANGAVYVGACVGLSLVLWPLWLLLGSR